MELLKVLKTSENSNEATVVKWLVAEGDLVEPDQPIIEMLNEKTAFEMWPLGRGFIRRIVAAENSTVPVGYILVAIGQIDEPLPEDIDSQNSALLAKARDEAAWSGAQAGGATSGGAVAQSPGSRVRATPAARRVAKEKSIDLAQVAASLGVTRALTGEDVERFAGGGNAGDAEGSDE